MWTSFSISPSIRRVTGMPVQRATTAAMSSASTSSLTRTDPDDFSSRRRPSRSSSCFWSSVSRPYFSSAAFA